MIQRSTRSSRSCRSPGRASRGQPPGSRGTCPSAPRRRPGARRPPGLLERVPVKDPRRGHQDVQASQRRHHACPPPHGPPRRRSRPGPSPARAARSPRSPPRRRPSTGGPRRRRRRRPSQRHGGRAPIPRAPPVTSATWPRRSLGPLDSGTGMGYPCSPGVTSAPGANPRADMSGASASRSPGDPWRHRRATAFWASQRSRGASSAAPRARARARRSRPSPSSLGAKRLEGAPEGRSGSPGTACSAASPGRSPAPGLQRRARGAVRGGRHGPAGGERGQLFPRRASREGDRPGREMPVESGPRQTELLQEPTAAASSTGGRPPGSPSSRSASRPEAAALVGEQIIGAGMRARRSAVERARPLCGSRTETARKGASRRRARASRPIPSARGSGSGRRRHAAPRRPPPRARSVTRAATRTRPIASDASPAATRAMEPLDPERMDVGRVAVALEAPAIA